MFESHRSNTKKNVDTECNLYKALLSDAEFTDEELGAEPHPSYFTMGYNGLVDLDKVSSWIDAPYQVEDSEDADAEYERREEWIDELKDCYADFRDAFVRSELLREVEDSLKAKDIEIKKLKSNIDELSQRAINEPVLASKLSNLTQIIDDLVKHKEIPLAEKFDWLAPEDRKKVSYINGQYSLMLSIDELCKHPKVNKSVSTFRKIASTNPKGLTRVDKGAGIQYNLFEVIEFFSKA